MGLLDSNSLDKFPALKAKLAKIDGEYLEKSRARLNKESKNNQKILDSVNKNYFQLRKDLLILAGTIFGSSVALAAGREVNIYFVLGELFLFISIVSGLVMLLTYLQGQEWNYAFSSKNSLESFLIMNKDRIEKFELDSTKNLAEDYKKIMESNQKGFLWYLLDWITIEKWPMIFNLSFLLGVVLILISIVPSQSVGTYNTPTTTISTPTPLPSDIYFVPRP